MIVSDYRNKKVVDYLKDGGKYLIVFHHGVGDTIMFYPIYLHLIEKFPKCKFDINLSYGQEFMFKNSEFVEDKYDVCFVINYVMAEDTPFTKSEYCCLWEIGMEYGCIEDNTLLLPDFESPFIGMSFHGTSMNEFVGVNENIAKIMWEEVREAGFIPIEIFFKHCFYNPANEKFSFIDNTCREYKADLCNLIGAIRHCSFFIGVLSGPLLIANMIKPNRTLCIEKDFKVKNYLKSTNMSRIDMYNYQYGIIKDWINKKTDKEKICP